MVPTVAVTRLVGRFVSAMPWSVSGLARGLVVATGRLVSGFAGWAVTGFAGRAGRWSGARAGTWPWFVAVVTALSECGRDGRELFVVGGEHNNAEPVDLEIRIPTGSLVPAATGTLLPGAGVVPPRRWDFGVGVGLDVVYPVDDLTGAAIMRETSQGQGVRPAVGTRNVV